MLRLTILFFLFFSSPGFASNWQCNDVDAQASLGYNGSQTVAVVGDNSNKTCEFSIGGASTKSAANDAQVANGDNPVDGVTFDRSVGYQLRTGQIDARRFFKGSFLRYLYTYVSAFDDGQDRVREAIREYALKEGKSGGDFVNCAFGSTSFSLGNIDVACQPIRGVSSKDPQVFERHSIQAVITSPYIVVELAAASRFFIVFIPTTN